MDANYEKTTETETLTPSTPSTPTQPTEGGSGTTEAPSSGSAPEGDNSAPTE